MRLGECAGDPLNPGDRAVNLEVESIAVAADSDGLRVVGRVLTLLEIRGGPRCKWMLTCMLWQSDEVVKLEDWGWNEVRMQMENELRRPS